VYFLRDLQPFSRDYGGKMNGKENLIIWQKWADPFGEDDPIDQLFESLDSDTQDEYSNFTDIDHENIDENPKEKKDIIKNRKNIKVMATPMGIIPVTENTASGRIFNFWTGHTNFNITKKIVALIEETNGVETLDIFTRYRFRISVGKAFDDSSVMRSINDNVYSYLE
jgi:hypothetical protein